VIHCVAERQGKAHENSIALLVLIGLSFFVGNVGGQTETILYSFGSFSNDEAAPKNLIQGSDGNFYGTIPFGGTSTNCPGGCGTVFRISPDGSYTNLYFFIGPPTDGYSPQAGLVQGSDGNLYGTTFYGGRAPIVAPTGAAPCFGSVPAARRRRFTLLSAIVSAKPPAPLMVPIHRLR
jgi:hypothetical protein